MRTIVKYDLNKGNFIKEYLAKKGVENIDLFLHPDESCEEPYWHLDNINEGLEMFDYAMQFHMKMNIIVDDDNDGFCSCALIAFFLRNIEYPEDKYRFIFHPHKEHGIVLEELDEDCDIVIAPDCGTADFEAQAILTRRGVSVLCLDHHPCTNFKDYEPRLNLCIINNQLSPFYKNKGLCGAGVTYKFLKAYCKRYRPDITMDDYVDILAIALVGDVMDLSTMENRYYVSLGLNNIQNPFFHTLIEKRAYSIGSSTPTPTDVAFYLIPAINAVIRMGTAEDKEHLFRAIVEGDKIVLSTKRGHAPNETEKLSEQVVRFCDNNIAKQRKERTRIADLLVSRIVEKGYDQDKIIIGEYYEEDGVNPSLTGLAAMELATMYQRPALVVKYNEETGEWSGSARNYGSAIFDLKQFLSDSKLLTLAAGQLALRHLYH